jgi:hypothetical protein
MTRVPRAAQMRSYFYFSNLRQSQIVYPSSLFRRITPLSLFHETEEMKLVKNRKISKMALDLSIRGKVCQADEPEFLDSRME